MEFWKGKIAVVTGASSGIGAAVVKDLAKAGVNVVGLARRKDKVEELATKNASLPGKIYAYECDVRDLSSVKAAFGWIVKTLGGVDILINNAGIYRFIRTFDEGNEEELVNTIQTNLTGSLYCAKAAFKSMKERDTHGYIINVNSIAGHMTNYTPEFNINVYGPSKHAIASLTAVMRSELVALNNRKVRISSISPGVVQTEIHEVAGMGNELYQVMPNLKASDVSNGIMIILGTPPDVHISELRIQPTGEAF